MLQHQLIVGILPVPQGIRLPAGAVIALLPGRLLLLVALIVRLLPVTCPFILLRQPLPPALVLLPGVFLQLRHQLHKLLHIALVCLLGYRLGIAAAVAPGECRRRAHGVGHSLPPLPGIQIGVVFRLGVRLRIIGKGLASGDLVIQPRQLPLKGGPVRPRLYRLQTFLHLSGRRRLIRGREALLQPVQGIVGLVGHPLQDLLACGRLLRLRGL